MYAMRLKTAPVGRCATRSQIRPTLGVMIDASANEIVSSRRVSMPFMLVPVPATVPALGPSKLVNMKPWDLIMLIGVIVGPSDADRRMRSCFV